MIKKIFLVICTLLSTAVYVYAPPKKTNVSNPKPSEDDIKYLCRLYVIECCQFTPEGVDRDVLLAMTNLAQYEKFFDYLRLEATDPNRGELLYIIASAYQYGHHKLEKNSEKALLFFDALLALPISDDANRRMHLKVCDQVAEIYSAKEDIQKSAVYHQKALALANCPQEKAHIYSFYAFDLLGLGDSVTISEKRRRRAQEYAAKALSIEEIEEADKKRAEYILAHCVFNTSDKDHDSKIALLRKYLSGLADAPLYSNLKKHYLYMLVGILDDASRENPHYLPDVIDALTQYIELVSKDDPDVHLRRAVMCEEYLHRGGELNKELYLTIMEESCNVIINSGRRDDLARQAFLRLGKLYCRLKQDKDLEKGLEFYRRGRRIPLKRASDAIQAELCFEIAEFSPMSFENLALYARAFELYPKSSDYELSRKILSLVIWDCFNNGDNLLAEQIDSFTEPLFYFLKQDAINDKMPFINEHNMRLIVAHLEQKQQDSKSDGRAQLIKKLTRILYTTLDSKVDARKLADIEYEDENFDKAQELYLLFHGDDDVDMRLQICNEKLNTACAVDTQQVAIKKSARYVKAEQRLTSGIKLDNLLLVADALKTIPVDAVLEGDITPLRMTLTLNKQELAKYLSRQLLSDIQTEYELDAFHILKGSVVEGQLRGFHYKPSRPDVKIGATRAKNKFKAYRAQCLVDGITTEKSFFPDSWSPEECLRSIGYASHNIIKSDDAIFIGNADNGMQIAMVLEGNQIKTAYPAL